MTGDWGAIDPFVDTPADVAAKLRTYARAHAEWCPKLLVQPFRKKEMDKQLRPDIDCQWHWLVPGGRWPCYEYAKIIVAEDADAGLRVGVSVERGYGAEASGGCDPSLIMRSNWAWHRFLPDLASGRVTEAARVAAHRTGLPFEALINVGPRGECWRFEITPTSLVLSATPRHRRVLPELVEHAGLEQLPSAFDQIINPTWSWIDVYLWTGLSPGGGKWHVDTVWERVVAPWRRWIA